LERLDAVVVATLVVGVIVFVGLGLMVKKTLTQIRICQELSQINLLFSIESKEYPIGKNNKLN